MLNFQACRRRVIPANFMRRRSALADNTIECDLDMSIGNESFTALFCRLADVIERHVTQVLHTYG